MFLRNGKCQFRVVVNPRKKAPRPDYLCDEELIVNHLQCAMSRLHFATRQLFAVRTANDTEPAVASFKAVLLSLLKAVPVAERERPATHARKPKYKPKAMASRSTTASAAPVADRARKPPPPKPKPRASPAAPTTPRSRTTAARRRKGTK